MLPFGYYELIDQFRLDGCAVCRALSHDTDRFLDTLLYEFVNEPTTQNNFRASRGLCNTHGWQITKQRNVLSLAILYQAALDEVITITETNKPHLTRLRPPLFGIQDHVAKALEPTAPCPACTVAEENEARYVQILAEHLEDSKLQSAYRASDGLCLEHFKAVSRQLPHQSPQKATLTEIQIAIWRRLQEELRGFIRKYDVHQAENPNEFEKDSAQRTLARISGERGMFWGRRNSKRP